MKKSILLSLFMLATLTASADDIMTKLSDGTYVVNTTELCNARGYKGTTPLDVHIKGNKIIKIVPRKNRETPKYFRMVEATLDKKYVGKKISKILTPSFSVDAVTGATFTSKAIDQNVRAAAKYYNDNK